MSKLDRFFRDMAFLCMGIIIGFLCAPVRKGINITIASNNTGRDALRLAGLEDAENDEADADFEYDDEDDLPPAEITVE
ncbi:MAG: hypothetical protein ACI3XY_03075 [Butyricicoccaceae bacterium]